MTGVERQGPAIVGRQAIEARHRGPIETLGDHLVEGEHAALASALGIRERGGRRIQLCCIVPMTVAGFAMTGRTILAEQRRAAREVRSFLRRQRHWVGGKQRGSQAVRDDCDLLGVGLVGDGAL